MADFCSTRIASAVSTGPDERQLPVLVYGSVCQRSPRWITELVADSGFVSGYRCAGADHSINHPHPGLRGEARRSVRVCWSAQQVITVGSSGGGSDVKERHRLLEAGGGVVWSAAGPS